MMQKNHTYVFLTVIKLLTFFKTQKYHSLSETVNCFPGQVGGNDYANKGGGVNNLCLPNDPENGKPLTGADNSQLFGTEYETTSKLKPPGMRDMYQMEVPCAVCHQRKKSVLLMIPGIK